jgi:hypothetical protein
LAAADSVVDLAAADFLEEVLEEVGKKKSRIQL